MSKDKNEDLAGPGQGESGGGPVVRIEDPPPADQKRPWSGTVIAIVSTGVALFGTIVALLAVTISGFISLSNRLSENQKFGEDRLEYVRTQLDDRIETIRQTIDQNLDAQNLRIHAIDRDQARLEGTVEGMQ